VVVCLFWHGVPIPRKAGAPGLEPPPVVGESVEEKGMRSLPSVSCELGLKNCQERGSHLLCAALLSPAVRGRSPQPRFFCWFFTNCYVLVAVKC
jgi:hypothetical protein